MLTGDLTECGLDAEYANLARLIRRFLPASVPLFVIPGNHDRREKLRECLAHLPNVTADPVYVQYAVEDFPVRLVMLDTLVPARAGHGELRGRSNCTVARSHAGAGAGQAGTLIGMHHPPFACGIAHMDRIRLQDAAAFVEVIARHKQVERIVCGHHHRAITAKVAHAIASISPSVAHQVEMSLHPDDPGAPSSSNRRPSRCIAGRLRTGSFRIPCTSSVSRARTLRGRPGISGARRRVRQVAGENILDTGALR